MGPSYNNSFGNSQMPGGVPAGGIGSGMAGAGGTAPVISSGSGDIVLAPSGNRQGSGKKWLLAVVVVLFVVAVVTGVAAVIVGNGGGSKNEAVELYAFLDEKGGDIRNLMSVVDYVYSGEATLTDFAPSSQAEANETVATMVGGLSALNDLQTRMDVGPELSGVKNEIDLAVNYEGLKNALGRDLEKYRSFVTLTTKLLQVTASTDVQEKFADEATTVRVLADEIWAYQSAVTRLNEIMPLGGACTSTDAAVCTGAMSERITLRDNANVKNPRIVQAYKDSVGEFDFNGEGSVMYYFNNLYAGTQDYTAGATEVRDGN